MKRLPVKMYDNGVMMFMCNVDFKSAAESKSNGKFEHIKNMHKIGAVTTEEAVNAVVNMCRAFNSEESKMKKVRPMIDKDLRDEIVNYCGGGESFNSALRYFAKAKARAEQIASVGRARLKVQEETIYELYGEVKRRDRQIIELKQEVGKLHNEKAELKTLYMERSKEVDSLNEKIKIASGLIVKLNSKREVMYKGALLGLIIGAAIGHLFL